MKNEQPILILQGSKQPYLSIGVRYGGIQLQGVEYSYFPSQDAFVRKDYVAKLKKHLKSGNNFDSFVEMIKK